MFSMRKTLAACFVAFLIMLVRPGGARAAFDVASAGTILGNTIPDVDFNFLTEFFGFSVGDVLNLSGESTATGWTETFTGVYQGQALNVTYTGDLSAYPGGAATWTSTGTYGGLAWSGSGSALFTDTSATTFSIQYLSTLTVGSNTGSVDLLISGTTDDEVTYTGTTGTITIGPAPRPAPPLFNSLRFRRLPPQVGDVVLTDITGSDGSERIIDRTTILEVIPPPNPRQSYSGTIQTVPPVPEPASAVMLGAGLLGLFGYGRLRCNRTG